MLRWPVVKRFVSTESLRKHVKEEAKRKKASAKPSNPRLDKWELTVGIEIHAELNTACKLFSSAPAHGRDGIPNSRVALFDAAIPGSQPRFQVATLLPALRAAIALGSTIQTKITWDRKHYFHWDQPNGYQITQYYHPFARDGQLFVNASDGVPNEDLQGADHLRVGIKQIQMEQDTAKTITGPDGTHQIDLNRAGVPLIEIITLPQIHSPRTASAVVRKIQGILKSVGACVTGMELGGLRADVNVSVRQLGVDKPTQSFAGVSGLGQRTEIKNLASFKAVEDAIISERDRQIRVLEAGGVIEGETRGWTLGATETTRLRGKEGEVDYRYMPDPDLPALTIGSDLIEHLRSTLPHLPDEAAAYLQNKYGLSEKDARTLVDLDDGERIEFLEMTVEQIQLNSREAMSSQKVGKLVGNWILHEIGGLLTASALSWAKQPVTARELADVLSNSSNKQITARAAKQLLATLFDIPNGSPRPSVEQLIDAGNLRLRPLSDDEYVQLARTIMDQNPQMVAAVRDKGQKGKIMWFVGQMVRTGEEGTVEPEKAKMVVEKLLIN
ncbi:hypothetical protein K470DRAFT_17789 [Piedraia hortae CBS 480.64]|uniref:Glutamyl-tRNA(Gln) amidotransferase subunit B, mitochondrial n=1 Tax=Piedraia hortae CBS 480.64 TaxID=1314780 RepID=A0A6A7C6C1_9PEZI|nr:hypothetical protein K470DRAFT_17789 [Piedraia hortae CBS 480.64]